MNCTSFRQELKSGVLTAEALEHMRSCASCLEAAVSADPDNLFRSLGGEAEPPGGIDAFAAAVMQQVHLRETEQALERRSRFAPIYRWSIAAALALVVAGVTLSRREPPAPMIAAEQPAAVVPANLPVIESYEEAGAMIVELPAQESDDMKVVMIFDETLPVDL